MGKYTKELVNKGSVKNDGVEPKAPPAPIACQESIRNQQKEIQERLTFLEDKLLPFLDQREQVVEDSNETCDLPSCFQNHSKLNDGFLDIYRGNEDIIEQIWDLVDSVEV